jgi:DNA transposition AAA+ family ATPase
MSSASVPDDFILTQEYRRFAEFCDACRRDRYIGLCYGPPGVGKTLSARYYANWFQIVAYPPYAFGADTEFAAVAGTTTVFYTPAVVNSPGRIAQDIQLSRHHLRTLALEALFREQAAEQQARAPQERIRRSKRGQASAGDRGALIPLYESVATSDIAKHYAQRREETADPTGLIIIDETDRLKTASLEQVRDIFDGGGVGVVLIGMPGLEKRLSRYPQLYSRVGFVHGFPPLRTAEIRHLLQDQWLPAGVTLPEHSLSDTEALAAIIRITGGNFRLLHRLLTQIARLVDINDLSRVTKEVVEAAREMLVIGTI